MLLQLASAFKDEYRSLQLVLPSTPTQRRSKHTHISDAVRSEGSHRPTNTAVALKLTDSGGGDTNESVFFSLSDLVMINQMM